MAAVAAILLTLVCPLLRGTRKQARVTVAESRLRQVGTTLDLYFRQHLRYPQNGLELWHTVSQSLEEPICHNPLREEIVPGFDLAALYRPRQLEQIDRPGLYLTSFPNAKQGGQMVVLETGGRVTRRLCPGYEEGQTQLSEWIAFFYPQAAVSSAPSPATTWGKTSYMVVRDTPSTIKFEDATLGLGEEGVGMTDIFAIQLEGAPEQVTVTTKTGTSSCQSVLDLTPGYNCTDALGFQITYAGHTGSSYRFEITAASNSQALSHATFNSGNCPVGTRAGRLDVPRMTPVP